MEVANESLKLSLDLIVDPNDVNKTILIFWDEGKKEG